MTETLTELPEVLQTRPNSDRLWSRLQLTRTARALGREIRDPFQEERDREVLLRKTLMQRQVEYDARIQNIFTEPVGLPVGPVDNETGQCNRARI